MTYNQPRMKIEDVRQWRLHIDIAVKSLRSDCSLMGGKDCTVGYGALKGDNF